jgi:integrase
MLKIRPRYWGQSPDGEYVRKSDGKQFNHRAWIVDYTAFDPVKKKQVRRHKTFEKQKDANKWRDDHAASIRAKTHIPDSESITVAAMSSRWIEAVKQGRGERGPAERSTLRHYERYVRDYISPQLGAVKLCDLTKGDVVDLKNDLLARLSRSMARKVLTGLKGLLNEAVAQNKVAVNVAAGVSIGNDKRSKAKLAVPAIVDIKAILAKLDELAGQPNKKRAKAWRRYRAFIATAIHTGMRSGELRGLPWTAVDLQSGKIEVRQRADEFGEVAETAKSQAGHRSIPIPDSLVQMLREWKLEAGGHALVFATSEGSPMSLANIYSRAWAPLQLKAGIADPVRDENGDVVRDEEGKPLLEPRYRFHDLRHFHASMLIADNANPKEVQAELGHSGIQITYDLYGHLFTDEEADKQRQERSERLSRKLT